MLRFNVSLFQISSICLFKFHFSFFPSLTFSSLYQYFKINTFFPSISISYLFSSFLLYLYLFLVQFLVFFCNGHKELKSGMWFCVLNNVNTCISRKSFRLTNGLSWNVIWIGNTHHREWYQNKSSKNQRNSF